MAPTRKSHRPLVVATCIVLVLALGRWVVPSEPTLAAGGPQYPDADSLGALIGYLAPVPAPALQAQARFAELDGRDPFDDPLQPALDATPAAQPRPRTVAGLVLSAILTSPDRRVAIIDDQVVGKGDALAGGGSVLAIEAGQVLVRDAHGQRRTLTLR